MQKRTGADKRKSGSNEEVPGFSKKRQRRDGASLEQRKDAKRSKKKMSTKSEKEVEDKLDKLIEQYRSKFSQRSSNKMEAMKQGSKGLRRWFES